MIMVGEIRDEETASLAINAALTGHLVLTTLHTNSAAGAIPRMRDMKVEAFLIASTVNLIMAQRLVRRLCQKCRRERKLDAAVIADIKKEFNSEEIFKTLVKEKVVKAGEACKDVVIYEAVGCKMCHDGYKGRIGIYETMEITPELQKMIVPTVTAEQLEQAAREQNGMVSMLEDGIIKTVEGMTTLEEVLRVARE